MGAKISKVDWDKYFLARVSSAEISRARTQRAAHTRFFEGWLRHINSIVPIYTKGLRVLEVGSGLGGALSVLESHCVRVTGSDISEKVVETGKVLSPTVPFQHFDIESEVPRGTFDRILSFEVLEHVNKLKDTVSHIYSALRKGGYFVGSTPYPFKRNIEVPTHVNVHAPDYWKTLFRSSGFRSVATYPMSVPPLIWRIHPSLGFVVTKYIDLPMWVSSILIVAKK